MSIFTKLKAKKISKKAIILSGIIVVAVVAAIIIVPGFFKKEPTIAPGMDRITVLEKTNIINTIDVSGTVKSATTVNISTDLTSKIAEIFVQVGDAVKKGDVVARLDSTDIQKEIAELKKKQTTAITNSTETVAKAQTEKDKAYDKAVASENDLKTAQAQQAAAQAAYNTAYGKISTYQNTYNNAVSYQTQKAAEDTLAQAAVADALSKMNIAKTNWDNAVLAGSADASEKETAYNTAKTDYQTAQNNYDTSDIKRIFTDAVQATQTAKAALDNAIAANNFSSAEMAYNQATARVNQTRETLDGLQKIFENADQALKNAKTALEDAKTNKELVALQEKLASCTIKAEANGVITALNMTVGSAPTPNSPLAVVQDTDNLVISTAFSESDIKNIKVGQEVIITSDATGDTEISGTVTQVSFTGGTSGNSSSVSFTAEIKVNQKDSGLLIGMNTKCQVVTNKTESIFAVPDDAIGTNMAGERYVLVKNGEAYDQIIVTTGVSTDYLTQIISNELKEGMIIRSDANENAGFAMDGMQSGDMAAGDMAAGGETSMVIAGPVGGGRAMKVG